MKSLDERMGRTDYNLYQILTSQSFSRFQKESDPDHHMLYRNQLERTIYADYSVTDDMSVFFVFSVLDDSAESDSIFVDLAPNDALQKEGLRKVLKAIPDNGGKWQLQFSEGVPCLVRSNVKGDFRYGAVINCEQNLPEFSYANYQMIFSDVPPDTAKNQISCSVSSSVADFTVTFSWPLRELTGSIDYRLYLVFAFLILCLLIIPVLTIVFHRKVSSPLETMNTAHRELLEGNESYRIVSQASSREFSDAFFAFNQMAETLQDLRLEKINRELAYKQMQLNNLQLQIRPHFLLNVMNLLYTLIHAKETSEAQSLVLYLSRYFRYMFRSGKDLELFSKELELIKEYLQVSQLHYPGAFTVSWQIDPVLELMRIPPLLLHNFVENIIQHALIPERTVHIVLFGEYEDGTVTLQVSDDGRGMAPEDVISINQQDFSQIESGKHIGIRNSIARLNYYYGEGTMVSVDSEPDLGTTFTIRFPYDLEGEEE